MANTKAVASGTADAAVLSGRGKLFGFSARENAGTPAAASFILRDGTDANGTPIGFYNIGPGKTLNGDFGAIGGLEFSTGLFLDRVSGTTELVVYV